jgi:carbon-monoxide dehydrogenase iron sulfur subunit
MIEYKIDKCVFCHLCEWACSFRAVEQIKPTAGAIQVARSERFGPISLHVCNLCEGSETKECIEACPEEALVFEGGVVKFIQSKCTSCLACVDACPIEAVAWDENTKKIIICDLCGGNPLCVEWCPEDVLSLGAA